MNKGENTAEVLGHAEFDSNKWEQSAITAMVTAGGGDLFPQRKDGHR
jgi:hypothetical protein